MSHFQYWYKKILSLCGLVLVVGILPHALPGPPFALYENWPTPPQQRSQLMQEYGFDRPFPVQFAIWLRRIVTGQWGHSRFHHRPVFSEVFQAASFTLLLLGWAGIACGLLGAGLWGCRRLFAWPNFPLVGGIGFAVLQAIPGFLVADMLHDLAIWRFGWFGMASVTLSQPYAVLNPVYMLFPSVLLAVIPLLAWSTVPHRAATRQASWWCRTRLSWSWFCHAMYPRLAGFFLELLLMEYVLSLPGLGSLGINALKRRDFPLFQGFLLCAGGLYFLLCLLYDRRARATLSGQPQHMPTASSGPGSNRPSVYCDLWGIAMLVALAMLAARLSPYSPTEIHSHDQLLQPGYRYILGTDFLGRDVLSRTLGGFQSSIPRVFLLTLVTGLAAWLGIQCYHRLARWLGRVWCSSVALLDAFPPLLLACMVFLVVEPWSWPLEATLILACLPSASRLLAFRAPFSQQLGRLARLGECLLMLEVLLFFLNLSPESLAPTWGSDIRHGLHYGHLNVWLALAPTLALVWSRYLLYQLGRLAAGRACTPPLSPAHLRVPSGSSQE